MKMDYYGSSTSASIDRHLRSYTTGSTYVMDETTPLLIRRAPVDDKYLNLNIMTLSLILIGGIVIGTYLLFEEYKELPISHPFDLVGFNYWNTEQQNNSMPDGPRLEQATNIVLLHTQSKSCTNLYTCSNFIRKLQSDCEPSGIPFNFLIGGDGITYEARGWSLQSGFDFQNKNASLVIAIIGDFTEQKPLKCQIDELEALIRESVIRGKLSPSFTIQGGQRTTRVNDAAELFSIANKWSKWESLIFV